MAFRVWCAGAGTSLRRDHFRTSGERPTSRRGSREGRWADDGGGRDERSCTAARTCSRSPGAGSPRWPAAPATCCCWPARRASARPGCCGPCRTWAGRRGSPCGPPGAFPRDVELSAGLLLDLGHTMMRSDRAEVAERGRALVSDVAEVTDEAAPAGDAHRRRRLLVLGSVERLASLAEDGPALLALEDLHWCDELSLEVIAHLARRLPSLPLLVVGTLRTDELHDNAPVRSWRSRLLLQRMAEEVRLPRLDAAQTAAMVARPAARAATSPPPGRPGARTVGRGAAPRRGAGPRCRRGPAVRGPVVRPGVAGRGRPPALRRPVAGGPDAAVAAAVIGQELRPGPAGRVAGRAPLEAASGLDELIAAAVRPGGGARAGTASGTR